MWSKNELKNIASQQAKELVEAGQTDNAKPIECHPITIRYDAGKLILTALIFNNSKTPFTLSSFKQWLDNITEAMESGASRIMVSGAFENNEKLVVASYLYKIKASGNYGILGQASDNSGVSYAQSTTWEDIFPEGTQFYDGVNKIN